MESRHAHRGKLGMFFDSAEIAQAASSVSGVSRPASAVVVAVADGKRVASGDAEPVGQSQQGGTLSTDSTLSGAPCTASMRETPENGRERACAISALSKNIQNFFHFVGVAAHPFVQIPHNMGTAIVRCLASVEWRWI